MQKQLSGMSVLELEAELQRLQVIYNQSLHHQRSRELAAITGEIQSIKKELSTRSDSHFKHNENA